jgi:recombinational DNA repair ATPase RecF
MNTEKISKVEIKSLWRKFDLVWNLNPDVNILSGINGSGKSTILECIAKLLIDRNLPKRLGEIVEMASVTFEGNKERIMYTHIDDTVENIELIAKSNKQFEQSFSNLKEKLKGSNRNKNKNLSLGFTVFSKNIPRAIR